uniref:Ectonucleoside triphosphate diphosphohydrolase 1 n=1 Tax=Eptatretus burgeri TaxID=7764 RepID=A0A8C4WY01_EPTBU
MSKVVTTKREEEASAVQTDPNGFEMQEFVDLDVEGGSSGVQCRSPNSSRWWKNIAIVLVICIVITVVCLAVVQSRKKTPSKYGVVADAGSSHTGIFVYQWLADKENGTGMVQQVMECTAEDPLTEFERKPDSTLHCLKLAVESVPAVKRAETTISLSATAGMRLLRLNNQSMVDHIFQLVRKTISASELKMCDVSILDDADEGAFGWITVNYLTGKLVEGVEGDSLEVPCFLKGYTLNMKESKLFGSPCTHQHNRETKEHNRTISLLGLGNPGACSSNIANLFSTLDFHQQGQPPLTGTFMAFSAFYHIMNFFNLSEGSSSPEQLNETVWTFCTRPWHEVKASWKIPEKYLGTNCFAGFYVLHLLTLGFHFNQSTWSNIKFVNKLEGTLGNGRAGWTLGYMLNLTNLLPVEAPVNPIHLVPFAVVMSFLVLGLFILLVLILFNA